MVGTIITILVILACHLLVTAAWYGPARRWSGLSAWPTIATMAFLLNAAIMLVLAYGLDLIGVYHPVLFWLLWVAVAVGANVWGRRPDIRSDELNATITRTGFALLLFFVLGLAGYVRVFDGFTNLSLAGTDSYVFLESLDAMLTQGQVISRYPAGLAVLLGHLQWGQDSLSLMRVGPPLFGVWASLSLFAFWQRQLGFAAALLGTILLGASVFFREVILQPTLYPQWVTLGVCLPPLLQAFQMLDDKDLINRRRAFFQGMVVLVVLSFTASMYGLLVVALLGLWLVLRVVAVRFRTDWRAIFRSARLVFVVPFVLLVYYGIALPVRLPEVGIDISEQSRRLLEAETIARQTISPNGAAAPLRGAMRLEKLPMPISVGLSFLMPSRFTFWRENCVENLFLLVAFVAGICLLLPLHALPARQGAHRGLISERFLGVLILTGLLSVVTGSLELPGYQGRMLYLLVLLVVPCASGMLIRCLKVGINLLVHHSRGCSEQMPMANVWCHLILGIALLSCVPVVIAPPVAGNNQPSRGALLRLVPEDNLLAQFSQSLVRQSQPVALIGVYALDRQDSVMASIRVWPMLRLNLNLKLVQVNVAYLVEVLESLDDVNHIYMVSDVAHEPLIQQKLESLAVSIAWQPVIRTPRLVVSECLRSAKMIHREGQR